MAKCTNCHTNEATGVLLTLCSSCMDQLEKQQEAGEDIVPAIVEAQKRLFQEVYGQESDP
jgi:hypothetical protein